MYQSSKWRVPYNNASRYCSWTLPLPIKGRDDNEYTADQGCHWLVRCQSTDVPVLEFTTQTKGLAAVLAIVVTRLDWYLNCSAKVTTNIR